MRRSFSSTVGLRNCCYSAAHLDALAVTSDHGVPDGGRSGVHVNTAALNLVDDGRRWRHA